MKHTYFFIALFLISANILFAQMPIIFQPAPGANEGTDEGSLTAGKDTWVYEGNTINYGDYPALVALPISNCNNTHCVAFIQFDLSTLPSAVDSVFLVFKHAPHTNYCYSGCDADFYFARNTESWNEMTVLYTNVPAKDTAFYGPINITFPNDFGVRQYDITGTYSLWKSGIVPNYGMSIYSSTVTCNNAAVSFSVSSSDDTSAASRPYLKVYEHANSSVKNVAASKLNCNLFPNPATSDANLEFNLESTQNIKFQLTDFSGRLVYSKECMMNGGRNKLLVPLVDFDSGLYIYSLTTKDAKVSGKLIKK